MFLWRYSWFISHSLTYFRLSHDVLPLFETFHLPLSHPDTRTFSCSLARKVKAITYCRARCVFVCMCASWVRTHMRSRVLLHEEPFVLVCQPSSFPPRACFPSQGRSPHAKGKKWGVKGTEFPLDLLLYAPSVPSLCHSALDVAKALRRLEEASTFNVPLLLLSAHSVG